MGLICCRESPCGSTEERSGLLTDESKTSVPTVEKAVGSCGPKREDDTRKQFDETNRKVKEKDAAVQMTQSHKNGEIEPPNTQENGPSQKESIQPASPHGVSEHKENSSTAQDETIKEPPCDSGQDKHLQCTLHSQQELHAASDLEDFKMTTEVSEEENPTSVQDIIPHGDLLRAGVVCPEKPYHSETTTTTEHITESTIHDNDNEAGSEVTNDNAVVEPSGEYFENVPAACPVSSSSALSLDIGKVAQCFAVTEDSNNGSSSVPEQAIAEDSTRPDVTEPSVPEPAIFTHSREKQDFVNSVDDPHTTAPTDASESLKPSQDAKPDPESLKEVTSLESIKQDTGEEMLLNVPDEDGDVSKVIESDVIKNEQPDNTLSEDEIQDAIGNDKELVGNTDIKEEVTEKEDSVEDSEEDLYRGAEELSALLNNKPQPSPVSQTTFPKVEGRCSLAPEVDILSYSEREWKGNTSKSALIRKGYKEMSQRFGSLRRVRGDNYCALRATLFQVLSHSTQLPTWLQEDNFTLLPKQLEAQEGLISQWTFPGGCLQEDGTGDATQQLKGYMKLLQNTWQAAVDCPSAAERQQLCERVFRGGEEELGLLEALKLLMLGRAVELHGCMQGDGDVPLFCWLLFARDSSACPRSFLSNHLSLVGLSAGLEQVEMFLLGYALQCTIQVYRLYKADTEEFVTYYPDDHKDEWPSVCLVTEDDRHYNVPVVQAADLHKELNTS